MALVHVIKNALYPPRAVLIVWLLTHTSTWVLSFNNKSETKLDTKTTHALKLKNKTNVFRYSSLTNGFTWPVSFQSIITSVRSKTVVYKGPYFRSGLASRRLTILLKSAEKRQNSPNMPMRKAFDIWNCSHRLWIVDCCILTTTTRWNRVSTCSNIQIKNRNQKRRRRMTPHATSKEKDITLYVKLGNQNKARPWQKKWIFSTINALVVPPSPLTPPLRYLIENRFTVETTRIWVT